MIATSSTRDTVKILGVRVDRVTMNQAIERIESFIKNSDSHVVVTADSSGLYAQLKDRELHSIMEGADLVTPDSFGVVWAAKKMNEKVEGRVNGVEIMDRVCALSAQKGYRLFFLGASPGVAEQAAERMRLKYPGTNIVGTRHGYFPSSDDAVVAEEIAPLKPDVLFVAMGIPRQEKFIASTKNIVKFKVGIGVGGSFDVFSGNSKRAPKLVQKVNLEWLWRLIQNPKKISKCASLPKFVFAVVKDSRKQSHQSEDQK